MHDLIGPRLRLEPLRGDHAAQVLDAMQDPGLYTWVPGEPPTAAALQRRYAFWEGARSPDGQEDWLNWVAFLRETQTPVGTFQATVPKTGDTSLAYTVFSAFWRQGYAREMALCVIPHLFTTYEMPGLYAEVDTRNVASIRLLESLDFKQVRTTRDADHFKGSPSDEYTYRRTRASWQAQ